MCVYTCVSIYIYIYIESEREIAIHMYAQIHVFSFVLHGHAKHVEFKSADLPVHDLNSVLPASSGLLSLAV